MKNTESLTTEPGKMFAKLTTDFEAMETDVHKLEMGNKSAARRVRVALSKMGKDCKTLRKVIQEHITK
jgi:hypothetical protein